MSIVMLFSTQHWIDFTIAYQKKKTRIVPFASN
jgi:hypothetical protein